VRLALKQFTEAPRRRRRRKREPDDEVKAIKRRMLEGR
jgi:hypothetical protein